LLSPRELARPLKDFYRRQAHESTTHRKSGYLLPGSRLRAEVDTRNRKFVVTPIMRDGGEGPSIDATDVHGEFMREQWQNP
jgi:hypothetical protein